jgi:hypothetical protein
VAGPVFSEAFLEMTTMAKTIEQVEQMGFRDAMDAIYESADSAAPDGGWDTWLINSVGGDEVCRLFGEPAAENQDGWSEAMAAKLVAYHNGGLRAGVEFEAKLSAAV